MLTDAMFDLLDDASDEEERRRIEIASDPMRWILDVLESAEWDADNAPPDVISCESVEVQVSFGGRRSREACTAVCTDIRGDRWQLTLSIASDAGGYWEQPDQDIEANWRREPDMTEIADRVLVETTSEPAAPTNAAPTNAEPSGEDPLLRGPLRAFAEARQALRRERQLLIEKRSAIDAEIAAIDAELAPAAAPAATRQRGFAPSKTTGSGVGSTKRIRQVFVASADRRVTFEAIVDLIGSSGRAGALMQNLIRSGQVKRLGSGVYKATDKLIEMAERDDQK